MQLTRRSRWWHHEGVARWQQTLTARSLGAVVALAVLAPLGGTGAQAADVAAALVPTQSCPATAVSPQVTPRAQYVSDRLRSAGYSAAATAGVLGNLDYLSALTPTAQSASGERVGLALWGPTRWQRYVRQVSRRGVNRWFLSEQTSFLLREMSADPGQFRHRRLQHMAGPMAAAVYFHNTFVRTGASDATVRATRGAKAAGWADLLAGRPVDRRPRDNDTYGLYLTCEPATGTVERCPTVPGSFRASFRHHTGFRWRRISAASQQVSRCVYANFPRIRLHGTYRPGHMPTWGRALDFMMPAGCVTGRTRSYTRSGADLALGSRLAQYLLRRGDRFGLDYVIWQDRIRNPHSEHLEDPFAPIDTWRVDRHNNGDCTNTHFDHVHMSVTMGA